MSATTSCCADSSPRESAWPNILPRTSLTWPTGQIPCREEFWATGHRTSFLKRSLTASMPSEPPTAVCSSSSRGFAPPSERTNRPCKDRRLSKLLQLAIAISQNFIFLHFSVIAVQNNNSIIGSYQRFINAATVNRSSAKDS